MTEVKVRRPMPARSRSGLAVAAAMLAALAGCSSPTGSPLPSATPTPTPGQPTESAAPSADGEPTFTVQTYPVPAGSGPHDVAPAADGGVWYTAQASGELGWLDPATGEVREVSLGPDSAPHGVIVGPDDAAWVTDSGRNAIMRVDPDSLEVTEFRLPGSASGANLNTAAFDAAGILWFTGQAGWYGSVDPATGEVSAFAAPRGTGPYGIAATPEGQVYYSSLAGSYLGAVDRSSGEVTAIDPPTAGAGLRRVWSDSGGRLWVAEWFAGQVGVYDPADGSWEEWRLPGDAPMAYAVYVDETDAVWLTDFGANAIVRFDPETQTFLSFPADSQPANVRQLLGRPGEVWGAESAADQLVVVRYGP
ncbi:MAG TPA: lyase [Candidatus Limnocylindria bacterium]